MLHLENPKISVIVPVYNGEQYLSECLDSIVNQTFKEIEIICVNDGSTDNSLSVLKEYASKDNRIKIIDKKNEGLGYSRKVGIGNATGKYILFCDSDDKYDSFDSFEKIYNSLEEHSPDVLIFGILNYLNGKKDKWYLNLDKYVNKLVNFKDILHYILNGCFSSCNKIYKKEFINKYNDWFFPYKIYYEDMPFHVQILTRANSIYILDNVYYLYRTNPNSITKSSGLNKERKKIESLVIIIETIYLYLKENDLLNILKKEFIYFLLSQLIFIFYNFTINIYNFKLFIKKIKNIFCELSNLNIIVSEMYLNQTSDIHLTREYFIFYKLFMKLSEENFLLYVFKKRNAINENLVRDLRAYVKQIENSFSYKIAYKIGKIIEYTFINNYDLLKKSDLFDEKYYLEHNKDVKIDPIKHYLKFGWKEGRNPSAKFDGNKYLKERPDVKLAKICPLVHYIKFGKIEKIK